MAKFRSPKELKIYLDRFSIVGSPHKAILIHPNTGKACELPADQVQHYLDKGFKWLKG